MKKLLLFVSFCTACAGPPKRPQPAVTDQRSYFTLTSGNGFGFALFDAKAGRLWAWLDHPYRYLHGAKDSMQNGPERRNLLQEFSLDGVEAGDTVYSEETNIIQNKTAHHTQYFFSPFGLPLNAFVAMVKADAPGESVARLRFNLGASPVAEKFWLAPFKVIPLAGEKLIHHPDGMWTETSRGRGTLIYLPLNPMKGRCEPKCAAADVTLVLRGARKNLWAGVLVAYVEDPKQVTKQIQVLRKWIEHRPPEAILEQSLVEWRNWRRPPPVALKNIDEGKLWRQSEAVLRMGQVLEPGPGHGQILASLAPGEWSIAWVRDASYAAVALARAGHFLEAKKALDFFLNAEPVGLFKSYVGGVDYRISVTRYFGNGAEEADYSEQLTPNVELDDWGLALWAARTYVEESKDLAWLKSATRKGSVYEALRAEVAEALAKQIETDPRVVRADSSIWEVHQANAHHFLFTSLMAARGFCDFSWLAHQEGQVEDVKRFEQLAKEVRFDLPLAFRSPEGYLLGAIERSPATDLDASAVELFNMGVIGDIAAAKRTFVHLNLLALPNGGYKRNGDKGDYDINEWVFVDYRMASAFFRRGDPQAGEELLDRLTARAAQNFYLLPEELVATGKNRVIGAYMGSIPMVGYGGGVQILAMMDRAGKFPAPLCTPR